MSRPYIVDLFSGGGGFTLGAYLAGFRTALAVEFDQDISYSYLKNFPSTPLLLKDISELTKSDILNNSPCSSERIVGVIGGPPCQGFSVIGRRDPDDPRNNLIDDFFRIVGEVEPQFFIMENVPGILSAPYRSQLETQLDYVAEEYKIVGPKIMDAADFGAATKRRRAIIIGTKRSAVKTYSEEDLPPAVPVQLTVAEALEALPSAVSSLGEDYREYSGIARESLTGYAKWVTSEPQDLLGCSEIRQRFSEGLVSGFQRTRHSTKVQRRFSAVNPGEVDEVSRYPRLKWDSPAPTLRAGTGRERGSYQAARPIHPEEDRVITVREAARIQGFPDWFSFHPTKWHSFRMIGNSVCPILAMKILESIKVRLVLGS